MSQLTVDLNFLFLLLLFTVSIYTAFQRLAKIHLPKIAGLSSDINFAFAWTSSVGYFEKFELAETGL